MEMWFDFMNFMGFHGVKWRFSGDLNAIMLVFSGISNRDLIGV